MPPIASAAVTASRAPTAPAAPLADPPRAAPPRGQRSKRLNFSDDNRAAHVAAFHAWLPEGVRDAPGVDWDELSSRTMGYLVRTVGASPWAAQLALGVGVWRVR